MTTFQSILAIAFWLSAGVVIYAYLGYPVLVFLLSRLCGRSLAPPILRESDLPTVSLLIAAHNEASIIRERIENALAMDYPADKLRIAIASDGSDDSTADICRSYEPRIRAMIFPSRRGKPATLNDAIGMLDSGIIVLSDANTMMDAQAVQRLARWFADPTIGAVCGRLVVSDPKTGRNADGVYWRYETFLKLCEARLGGPLGANGAIYALRRSLFSPLPDGTIVDDFVLPLTAKLRSGCRIVYDAQAVAFEESAPDLGGEFRRRVRIGIGCFQSLGMLWPLLSPRHGWTCFTFWSHKIARWNCPFAMLGALATAAALAAHPFYGIALALQLAFYTFCLLAAVLPPANRLFSLARVFPLFAGMNLALLVGFVRWVRGGHTGIWRRTARSAAQ